MRIFIETWVALCSVGLHSGGESGGSCDRESQEFRVRADSSAPALGAQIFSSYIICEMSFLACSSDRPSGRWAKGPPSSRTGSDSSRLCDGF